MFQKRDLTCKRSRRLHVLEEERLFGSSRAERDFWAHLGVEGGEPVSAAPAGPPGEDEEYEQEVNEMNMVWEVRVLRFFKKGFWDFDHQKKKKNCSFSITLLFAMMFEMILIPDGGRKHLVSFCS